MQFIEQTPLTITATNVVDEILDTYDITLGYKKADKVVHDGRVYEAYSSFGALAAQHYVVETQTTTRLADDVIIDSTAAPVVDGVTVVYVEEHAKYYLSKFTGTIDYTAENPVTPSHFDEITVGGYRHENTPPVLGGTLYWKDLGATNQLKIFDEYINTQSEHDTAMTYTFSALAGNTIALFNLEGISATVTVGGFTTTVDLTSVGIQDWGDYFYAPVEYRRDVLIELPQSFTSTIELTITGDSAKCGAVVYGTRKDLGATLLGAQFGIDDYSTKVISDAGNIYVKEGKYNKRANLDVSIANSRINAVASLLTDLRATRTVFVGDETDTYEYLLVYGYYQNFEFQLPNGVLSSYSIELKGLT